MQRLTSKIITSEFATTSDTGSETSDTQVLRKDVVHVFNHCCATKHMFSTASSFGPAMYPHKTKCHNRRFHEVLPFRVYHLLHALNTGLMEVQCRAPRGHDAFHSSHAYESEGGRICTSSRDNAVSRVPRGCSDDVWSTTRHRIADVKALLEFSNLVEPSCSEPTQKTSNIRVTTDFTAREDGCKASARNGRAGMKEHWSRGEGGGGAYSTECLHKSAKYPHNMNLA